MNKLFKENGDTLNYFLFSSESGNTILHEMCISLSSLSEKELWKLHGITTQDFYGILNYIEKFSKLDVYARREELFLIKKSQIKLLKDDNFESEILVEKALKEMEFIMKLYNCSESKKVMSLLINRKNNENETALDLAIKYNLTEFIKELKKYA